MKEYERKEGRKEGQKEKFLCELVTTFCSIHFYYEDISAYLTITIELAHSFLHYSLL